MGAQSSRPKWQRASLLSLEMSTVLGVRLCGSDCSATPHVASKTTSKERVGNVRTFCFFLIAVVDVLLVREFLHAGGPWVSRARGVEWPQPVRDRQNQARLSPQRNQGSDHSRIIPSKALLSPKVLTRCALHVLSLEALARQLSANRRPHLQTAEARFSATKGKALL